MPSQPARNRWYQYISQSVKSHSTKFPLFILKHDMADNYFLPFHPTLQLKKNRTRKKIRRAGYRPKRILTKRRLKELTGSLNMRS